MSLYSGVKRTYVGSLACQRDSFLFEGFQTTVISSEPTQIKDKAEAQTVYQVEFEDTILFPEGGGQPSDSGYLKVIESSDGEDHIPISYVSRTGLHAKHHIGTFIEPGTKVELAVDASKRIDYMQQHTGQHLLSAILEKRYKLDTLSWSMGGVPTEKKPELEMNDYFNYIEIPKKLTKNEVNEVSKIVNEYITVDPQEILVVERRPDAHGGVETSKIPDDYDLEKGILRTIHIGSLDANPCCGTHLKSTGQIGSIMILPIQTTVRGTNSRLYFMCGNRVTKYGCLANEVLSDAKAILSCSEAQIPDKVGKQREQIQKANKREQFWMKELAQYEAAALTQNVLLTKKAYLLKDDYGTLEYLLQVFKEVSKACKNMAEYEIILCGREKQSEMGSVIILSESGEKIASISHQFSSLIKTLKGGGGKKGGKWQGKVVNFNNSEWEAVKNYLADYVSE